VKSAASDDSVGGRLREQLGRSTSREHTTVISNRTGRTVNIPKRLSTEEAAGWLNLSEGTLRWYRHKGDRGPRSYCLGSRIFYDLADLEEWAEVQKCESSRGGVR
jgi:hypothetical protein